MTFRHYFRHLVLIVGLLTFSLPGALSAVWQIPNPFPSNGFGTINISSGVATNNSGLAAVLISENDTSIEAYTYSNGTWSGSPTATFPTTNFIFDKENLDLAMETSGTAIGAWADNSLVGNTVYFDGIN